MGKELGTFFRTLRKRKGLTQQQWAWKAQISLRAVTYWEAGAREPRIEELQCALRALDVTQEEQEQVYLLMKSSRGLQRVQQQAQGQGIARRGAGTMPDIGDLLTALRLRRGWTRQQLANEMCLEFSTVSRWEHTENLPTEENLDRLCTLLDAHLEERLALTTRRLLPQTEEQDCSPESALQRVQKFCDEVDQGSMNLIDLHALALKRNLWLSARHHSNGHSHSVYEVLMARAETAHSLWLLDQNRIPEAGACADRAIKLCKMRPDDCDFLNQALNIASYHAVWKRNGDPTAGIEYLCSHLSNGYLPGIRAIAFCDMAYYTSAAGRHAEALRLLHQARYHAVPTDSNQATAWYYQQTQARVLANAGRFKQSLEALPEENGLTGRKNLFPTLVRAEILWKAGQRAEAHSVVQKLYAALTRYPSTSIQTLTDALAQQM